MKNFSNSLQCHPGHTDILYLVLKCRVVHIQPASTPKGVIYENEKKQKGVRAPK